MDLSEIVSISGHGGLFKVLSHMKNGIVVQGLGEEKKMPVHATQKVVALDDISIYTYSEDIPLAEVLLKIHEKENGGDTISHKSSADELKTYMESILPEYDQDRVYVSDIKKLVKWYGILNEHGLITKEEKEKEKKKEEKKTEKKAEKKEAADKKEKKTARQEGGETKKDANKPKKKTAKKKASSAKKETPAKKKTKKKSE